METNYLKFWLLETTTWAGFKYKSSRSQDSDWVIQIKKQSSETNRKFNTADNRWKDIECSLSLLVYQNNGTQKLTSDVG
jgi:hypothetical protein